MTNLIELYEKEQIEKLVSKKRIPAFRAGDTIKVTLKIVEGERSRLQAFEGICIARKNSSLKSSYTIRKISHGEGVEKVFPLFSPIIDKIEVIRKGRVRRSKLYYLKNRKGRSARIVDRDRGKEKDQYELTDSIEENMSNDKLDSSNISNEENQTKENRKPNEELSSKIEENKKIADDVNVSAEEIIEKKSESSSADAGNSENDRK